MNWLPVVTLSQCHSQVAARAPASGVGISVGVTVRARVRVPKFSKVGSNVLTLDTTDEGKFLGREYR